ncbi:MAG: restriction endonuclease subunit S [Elusimicrobiota bacterium]
MSTYLYWIVQTQRFIAAACATSGSKMPRADWDWVSEQPFLLPPITEQKQLCNVLNSWEHALSLTTQLLNAKRKLKKGLMQQLLTGKQRFSKYSTPWRHTRLGNIGKFSKGAGVAKSDAVSEGLPAVRYGELYTTHHVAIKQFQTKISRETAKSSREIKQGDILFAGSGETPEEIGKAAVFLGNFEAYAGGDIVILSPKKADSLFLSYLLNSDVVRGFIRSRAQGYSVVHLYRRDLEELPIRIPEVDEQRKIASALAAEDTEIDLLVSCTKALTRQKLGLLQKLLPGEIRMKEALNGRV